ncbi:fatty acid--CoA ligase [Sphingomonas sp. 35-24ZXX]|uniref:fatty acid--CoA ligase n=1 Tax=Sphingomonas sp. 35-24ZXX TaxID=1545915 RepID=UPI00053BE1E4|nr:fatty acid--CoA ligase [Sphingomonas sp. 35-24ZXX]
MLASVTEARTDLGSTVRYWAEERPDGIALDDGVTRISYRELDEQVDRYARAFAAAGLEPDSRIAWLGKNASLYFILLVAASRAGLAMVPVGWRLAVPEIRYILADTGAALLVCQPGFAATAQAAAEGLDSLRTVLVDTPEDAAGLETLDDWAAAQGSGGLPDIDPERGVLQLYTSGTTGNPKGAVLCNRNMFALRPIIEASDVDWYKISREDSMLVIMPVAHIAGSGVGTIAFYNGCRAVIRAEFSPDAVLDCVSDGVTHMFLVPTALQMVVNHPRAGSTDWSRLKLVMYGAAPIPLELLRQCMQTMGAEFCQQYGMTETTGTFCALPPEDHDPAGNERMRSAGKALPGVEIRIVDGQGQQVPNGTIGEIATRSPLNMVGYWRNDAKTRETVDADGWLLTGDAAYMDDDGYVFIQDRVKDMIISGGENVYPAEVENAIFGHPDVLEVAVIGTPDDKWGEAVKAVVVPKPGHEVDPASVISWARERIAPFKAPKSIDVIPEMPRNATGKILRRELRAPYWVGRDRAVG